jgi:hypothetical protein
MESSTFHRDATMMANEAHHDPREGAAMLIGSWALLIGMVKLLSRAGHHHH